MAYTPYTLPNHPTAEHFSKWLANEVDSRFVKRFEAMITAGEARWIPDPEVRGVYGLQRTADHAILLVIYRDGEDFETSLEGDKEVFGA